MMIFLEIDDEQKGVLNILSILIVMQAADQEQIVQKQSAGCYQVLGAAKEGEAQPEK